jgi:hypothetical protein
MMDRGWIDGRITAELIDIRKEYVAGIQDRVSVSLDLISPKHLFSGNLHNYKRTESSI